MDKEYKLIIFDLGNTIIRFDHNISAKKLAERFGLDQKAIYDTFFDSEVTRKFDTGAIIPRQFYSEVKRILGIDLPYKEFADIWSDVFWEDEKACHLVRRLKERHKLCLLSNVNKLHFDHIKKRFDIIKVFDYVVLSYLVGALKPDRKIYEYASRLAGIDFPDILYIDDREDLIKEAGSYGIESLKFDGAAKLEGWLLERKVL